MKTNSTSQEDHKQRVEFLLDLNSAKIRELEKALEQNWFIHVILSGVGVALIFNIGHLQDVLAKYFAQAQYNAQAVAAILLPVFLYQFMRLGQLVTAFNEARQLQEQLLQDYLGGEFHDLNMEPFHRSTSYLAESFVKKGNWSYLLVTTAIVTIAQASALFLFVQAYGVYRFSVAILVVSAVVMSILYFVFWKGQSDRHRATLVVSLGLASFALVFGLLLVFARVR
jgi:hypothetical protein